MQNHPQYAACKTAFQQALTQTLERYPEMTRDEAIDSRLTMAMVAKNSGKLGQDMFDLANFVGGEMRTPVVAQSETVTIKVADKISGLPMVSKVVPWKDRTYITLKGFDSGFNGDRTRKIWIKDNILTIERGKGIGSGAFNAAFADFLAALDKLGATTEMPFKDCRLVATYDLSEIA